jgi:hypothetical protein
MKNIGHQLRAHRRRYALLAFAAAAVCFLLLYKLGSLVGGLSAGELAAARTPVGWHGIYHQPLYLPLNVVRSVVFFLFADHGQTLTRLPNAFFGLLAIFAFGWLAWLWHGRRTAVFAGCLFAASAWVLHVSRLASFDVLYLWAMTTLLLAHVKLQRQATNPIIFYVAMLLWGMLLYVPGMIWLLLVEWWLQRRAIVAGWGHFSRWWQRMLYLLSSIIWLPLLVDRLRSAATLKTWLGLPQQLDPPLTLLKHFVGVFVHLFVRGPEYHDVWLGRAPLLGVFALAASLIGIYFYARNFRAGRGRLLGGFFLIGAVLIALGGPVGLSLLVPLVYLFVAARIAFLLREWLRTFPLNPLARGAGISLVALAVALSCAYNLRAYFVAWPHNHDTKTTFRYHL